jgi:hypothetical protein
MPGKSWLSRSRTSGKELRVPEDAAKVEQVDEEVAVVVDPV